MKIHIFDVRVVVSGLMLMLQSSMAGDVTVAKSTYLEFPFRGFISDIAQCRLEGTNLILILAQNHGVLINEDKTIQKELSVAQCFDPKASQIGDTPCIIYCRGGGFSPVYAADLNGNELWKFNRPGTVSTVARDEEGRFYVCTFREVCILNPQGEFIKTINEHVFDIKFGTTNVLTISSMVNKRRERQIDIRDANFNRISSFPIESEGRNIVAYNWPETAYICYVSKAHLVVLNQQRKTAKRFDLEDVVVGTGSAVVQDNAGEEYLALLALYKPGKASSKLFIFSKQLELVYQESLPISTAVSTLGTSNRLYIGAGTTKVFEYQLHRKQ